ncbi:MAG: DNA helicase PcrA [bacterium]
MDILQGLNPAQAAAVQCTEGPLLILAGAGSGKTRVLTHRIAYLLRIKNVSPRNILAITFTNKAADEMKGRVASLLPGGYRDMWVCTFHAACVRILRADGEKIGLDRHFVIFDGDDQLNVVKTCLKDMNLDDKQYAPRAVLAAISNAKNELMGPEEYAQQAGGFWEERIGRIYRLYQRKLADNKAVDFDDLLRLTVQLFQQYPEVLTAYQERFRYILVDEYQDTNRAQYTLVRQLASRYGNICVVGDDDQSIYGWRGADIRNILDFERDYPDARVVKLEQNYRSTQTILDAANHLMGQNSGRKEKKLWTQNKRGEGIVRQRLGNEHDEAVYVASEIRRRRQSQDWPYSAFAVLYRMNAQSRVVEEIFMRHGIPYTIVGGLRFYDRKEIKDIIAYLRVIYNPADSVSLERIINVPRRGIGSATLEKIRGFALDRRISLYEAMRGIEEIAGVSPRIGARVKELTGLLDPLMSQRDTMSILSLLEAVVEKTGYQRELESERTEAAQARVENIKEFYSVAQEFSRNESGRLEEFLARISLLSDVDTLSGDDAVVMMTLHSAKGLEFPAVFLIGMEEGIFPHARALEGDTAELEEERRLCYVGITRAQEYLYMTRAERRSLFGRTTENEPSRFLDEIPAELCAGLQPAEEVFTAGTRNTGKEYGLGEKVRHAKWGLGVVIGTNGSGENAEVVVSFKTVGIKKLAVQYAPLSPAK